MVRCLGKGCGRVIGLLVFAGLVASVLWRMEPRLGLGPAAAVFVVLAPACWFAGVFAAAATRSVLSWIDRRPASPVDPAYLPVEKPFDEMTGSELDAWVERSVEVMIDAVSGRGGGSRSSSPRRPPPQ